MLQLRVIALVGLFCVVSAVGAKPPVRNMTVELRMVTPAELETISPGSYVVRTQAQSDEGPDIQKLFVLNGERGQMKLSASVPQQWVKTAPVPGAQGTQAAQGTPVAESALTWMDAGQELSVLVNWPGGKNPATLDIAVDTAALESRNGQNLPTQLKNRFATKVVTPLGVWSTIAVTGKRPALVAEGVYSTTGLDSDQGKLVQVRVLAP